MSSNQEKDILYIFSKNEDNIINNDSHQLVLQIPSDENECQSPTLLMCSAKANSDKEYDLCTTTLDDMLNQVKENYANDTEALQRFSYYLVLKAKEMSA